jgi:hypothetical protein
MQGAKELSGDDLKEMELQSTLFSEMKYAQLGYKMTLKGIEEVNGKDAYTIELTGPTGDVETEYYEVSSGLKLKTLKTEDAGPQGTMTITSEYSDYREVDGVKFPYEINQNFGPQSLKAKVQSVELNKKIPGIFYSPKYSTKLFSVSNSLMECNAAPKSFIFGANIFHISIARFSVLGIIPFIKYTSTFKFL